ncbi:THO complex subunit 6 homolog [Chelonus insularis]|uniref:THO complex subunit 6 homolog n=1 Tax=Chelonus insularis TaxID=460826 RepID=UPI00158B33A5|nr:THO complex subunit 6 homolog [Chelonus insularis]
MPEHSRLKLFYNTVLCQCFSPSGKHLVAGNIYGDISVYDLTKTLAPTQSDEDHVQGPTYKFTAYAEQHVQSMVSTDNFLVTGTAGEISGWDWNAVTSSKASKIKASWIVQIPVGKDSSEKPDVNYLVFSKEKHSLYAGCGDNKIYIINLENGKILKTLEGHENYIHSLALMKNQLVSGSEDGSVRIWDLRTNENTNILKPYVDPKVARQKLGKWIGAVDFTEDWLLCGGGPSLSLWHLRTMEPATIFSLPDHGIHEARIYEERIITGGSMPFVYHLNYNGEILAEIPTSSNTVYSIVYQEKPQKVVSIAGSSNKIDICTNFNYRELVFKFS